MECILKKKFGLGLWLLFSGLLVTVPTPGVWASDQSADQLMDEGHRYLNQGIPSKAFQIWGKAKQKYKKQGNSEGVQGSLVNQAQAQQMLGQHVNACWSLIQVLSFDASVCRSHQDRQSAADFAKVLAKLQPTPVNVAALQHLGISSRELWKFEQAVQALKHALKLANQLEKDSLEGNVRLSLANTYQAQMVSARERYQVSDDKRLKNSLLQKTLEQGQQAFAELDRLFNHTNPNIAMKAKINWLQLYQRVNTWIQADGSFSKLKTLRDQVEPMATTVILDVTTSDYSEFIPILGIYARLKVAESLLKLHQVTESAPGINDPIATAFRLTDTSLERSKVIENKRAQANSLVTLGTLQLEIGKNRSALAALTQAQNLGISITASDTVYRASWQLAKLHQNQGRRDASLRSYKSAIAALEDVRGNLLTVNRSLQFSFREEIEPLYRQYLQLLSEAEQPDYETILTVNGTLQILAIENFLQCGKLEFSPLKEQPNLPTTFYLLDLVDQLVVLVRKDGVLHRYSVDSKNIKFNAARLLDVLQSNNLEKTPPDSFLPFAQALYQHLIEPGEHLIGQDRRIVIVANDVLNNLPLGILHDGDQYLLEKYTISASLGSFLESPQRKSKKPKALLVGMSELSPVASNLGYEALPEVEQEHANIAQVIGRSTILLNRKFTFERLKEQLLKNYSILHIATHGKFSSNSADTYLLGWKDRLGVIQLEQLLRQRAESQSAGLDLLFLSACESAKGDRRSELGLAGLATQAGAKNAIATLWRVDSASTSVLASEFYQQVANGQPYAKALQKAQLKLMNTDGYRHPYHWAPFILLGGL